MWEHVQVSRYLTCPLSVPPLSVPPCRSSEKLRTDQISRIHARTKLWLQNAKRYLTCPLSLSGPADFETKLERTSMNRIPDWMRARNWGQVKYRGSMPDKIVAPKRQTISDLSLVRSSLVRSCQLSPSLVQQRASKQQSQTTIDI
jgi:hypothetical protein